MKFAQSVSCLLLASQALAVPLLDATASSVTTDLVAYQSTNPDHAAVATLEKRINCQKIQKVIHTIGTSRFTSAFISAASVLTRAICAYWHGADCAELVDLIQSSLNIIYLAAAAYSNNAEGANLPGKRDNMDYANATVEWWINALAGSEATYDSITSLDFNATEAALTRRDGDPRLVSRVQVSGVPMGKGRKHDVIANHFEDGNTVLHLPFAGITSEDGSLTKRSGAAGFKISYTTRGQSKLTEAHRREMSGWGAAEWANNANRYPMTDMIGFAETDHTANFYYRIIPELNSFGLNYESVDICGGMASML